MVLRTSNKEKFFRRVDLLAFSTSPVQKFIVENHGNLTALVAAPRKYNTLDRVIDSLGRLWDEALHPRDNKGKFIKKNGAVSGKLMVPSNDRSSISTFDVNRASVVGFRTINDDVWVLAEFTDSKGTKQQGFAKATSVKSVAPVKARIDALYPLDTSPQSVLERNRQLDLIVNYIMSDFPFNEPSINDVFRRLDKLDLNDEDTEYILNRYKAAISTDGVSNTSYVLRDLTDEEKLEQKDIINDARNIKKLRDRVHKMRKENIDTEGTSSTDGELESEFHTQPKQKFFHAVSIIESGADPFLIRTKKLLQALATSIRFKRRDINSQQGVSPIYWFVDDSEDTGYSVGLAGVDTSTSGRAIFVKQSVMGVEYKNNDIVREVLASEIHQQLSKTDSEDASYSSNYFKLLEILKEKKIYELETVRTGEPFIAFLYYGTTDEAGEIFFSDIEGVSYTSGNLFFDSENSDSIISEGNIFLSNPKVIDVREKELELNFEDEIKKAKEEGHDGIVFKDVENIGIVFDQSSIIPEDENIKSNLVSAWGDRMSATDRFRQEEQPSSVFDKANERWLGAKEDEQRYILNRMVEHQDEYDKNISTEEASLSAPETQRRDAYRRTTTDADYLAAYEEASRLWQAEDEEIYNEALLNFDQATADGADIIDVLNAQEEKLNKIRERLIEIAKKIARPENRDRNNRGEYDLVIAFAEASASFDKALIARDLADKELSAARLKIIKDESLSSEQKFEILSEAEAERDRLDKILDDAYSEKASKFSSAIRSSSANAMPLWRVARDDFIAAIRARAENDSVQKDIANRILESQRSLRYASFMRSSDARRVPRKNYLMMPRSVFGDNPDYDTAKLNPDPDMASQPAHVISEHGAYLVPPDWTITKSDDLIEKFYSNPAIAVEEAKMAGRLRFLRDTQNDIRNLVFDIRMVQTSGKDTSEMRTELERLTTIFDNAKSEIDDLSRADPKNLSGWNEAIVPGVTYSESEKAEQERDSLAHMRIYGDIFGNDIFKMILFDFVASNPDRNGGNALLAMPPDRSEGRVILIDHAFAFFADVFKPQPKKNSTKPVLLVEKAQQLEPYEFENSEAQAIAFLTHMSTTRIPIWLKYILGGLAESNNVTLDSMTRVMYEFLNAYSNMDADEIIDRMRSIPNIQESQIKVVEDVLPHVIDKITWLKSNVELVLKLVIGLAIDSENPNNSANSDVGTFDDGGTPGTSNATGGTV